MHPTSFLINDETALDAGAISTMLDPPDQARIRRIFLTHAHMDHIATLPFFLDNVFDMLDRPVIVYGLEATISCIENHIFNNSIWPDFGSLSNRRSSILSFEKIKGGVRLDINGTCFTTAPMKHSVECCGYLVEDKNSSIFISGDTCSIDGALGLIEKAKNLKAVIIEASFPDRMRDIAVSSRHLTTSAFAAEKVKLPENVQVLVTHAKPSCYEEIRKEIADLGLENVSMLEQGKTYEW